MKRTEQNKDKQPAKKPHQRGVSSKFQEQTPATKTEPKKADSFSGKRKSIEEEEQQIVQQETTKKKPAQKPRAQKAAKQKPAAETTVSPKKTSSSSKKRKEIESETEDEQQEQQQDKVEKTAKKARHKGPSDNSGYEADFDSYTLNKAKDSESTIKRFSARKSTQRTASTYSSVYEKNFPKEKVKIGKTNKTKVIKDNLQYRRNQKGHEFSDRSNTEEGTHDIIPKMRGINNETTFLGPRFIDSKKLTENKHNFGMNPSFGHQIKFKSKLNKGKTSAKKIEKQMSATKKKLDDDILAHKVANVEAIVTDLQTPEEDLKTIKIYDHQLNAKYPCVIVSLNDAYPQHATMIKNDVKEHYDGAYPEFLTHLMIACINKQLMDQNLGVYFDRRQSFGFLTPTASDVGPGIRLSLGLVPNEAWKDAVVAGIQDFDKLLHKLWEEKIITPGKPGEMGLPQARFRAGDIQVYGHKVLLKALTESKASNKTPEVLATILKNLKTEEGLNNLNEQVVKKDYFKSIVDSLKEAADDSQEPASPQFSELTTRIATIYDNLNTANAQLNADALPSLVGSTHSTDVTDTRSNNTILTDIVEKIEEYQETSLKKFADQEEITATSDSDLDYEGVSNADKKYYTPTGMSALVAPLIAYKIALAENVDETSAKVPKVSYKVEQFAYFELESWQTKSENKLDNKTERDTNKGSYNANIIYVDNNPCVVGSTPPISTLDVIDKIDKVAKSQDGQAQMLIVDTTSATENQKKEIIDKWKGSDIAMLCFATSGLKNKQFGLDMAQYGENKLFINENLNSKFTKDVAQSLRKITKGSSSAYATTVIRDLREAAANTATIQETTSSTSSHVTTIAPPAQYGIMQQHTIPSIIKDHKTTFNSEPENKLKF